MENAIVTYLLHFTQPLERGQHYLGSALRDQLTRRIIDHQAGRGSRITRQAVQAGAHLVLVRTWYSKDRGLERALKRNGHMRKLCGICRGQASLLTPQKNSASASLDGAPTLNWIGDF